MKTITELRKMTKDEMHEELIVQRREQLSLRFKKAHGEQTKTHLIRKVRRAIAQIKTVMSEGRKE